MLNKQKRIILLLDESGSMGVQRDDVIGGVNSMIEKQRELQDEPIEMVIVKFSSEVVKARSALLTETKAFTKNDYTPSGSTALYDAIGKTISRYSDDVDDIMVIVTDGQENASREYTQSNIIRLINQQRNAKNWNFIYLSEDPTTVRQGNELGLSNNVKQCSNTYVGKFKSGQTIGSSSLQNYISDVCKKKTSKNFDDWQKL